MCIKKKSCGDMGRVLLLSPVSWSHGLMSSGLLSPGLSERIMGSESLQPDMMGESAALLLEDENLTQLRDKFCCRVKVRRPAGALRVRG